MSNDTDLLETISQVLWRCVVIGLAFVLVWYIAALFPDSFLWASQQRLLGLTPHECALVNYGGIGLAKLLLYVFFLIPWAAIRLVLRSRRR